MDFIRKIFENKADDEVHLQFQRFSKGIFENRALVEITRTSKETKIKTSYEFTRHLINHLISGNVINLSGMIMCTTDLRKLGFEFPDVKQFMGVKKFDVANLTKENIINLMQKLPDALFLLSFETEKGSIKTKQKAPKSGKTADKEQKADFCVMKTTDFSILDDFAFDLDKNFEKASIKHTFVINEIIVPEEYKNDSEKARKFARRKGKIIRYVDVDGKLSEKETGFEA